MMKKILIWGASGHARVVADIVRLRGEYEIAGFLDDINPERHRTQFCGATVLGGHEQLAKLRQQGIEAIVLAFGNCEKRLELSSWVKSQGFLLATAIHPAAVIASDVMIAQGAVVAAGAVINPMASIGESVIVNSLASVDHDCYIDAAVHVCPGVHIGGGVTVGCAAWIGIGAIVKDKVCIGRGSVIGAGAVVINDIPDDMIAYGVPAKPVRRVAGI
jgi:sugar O-acyltransferase (sialic acid O-acetyltransferase NeuD family)